MGRQVKYLLASFQNMLNIKELTLFRENDMKCNTSTDSIACRSQLATIVLAAREEIVGVIIGGVLGHALCTGIMTCLNNSKGQRGGYTKEVSPISNAD